MREGWPVVTLAEVCTKIQDGAHRSPQILHSEPGPGRFPYLTSKNIRTGYLKLDSVQYCEADFHNEIYPRCNPELGDLLLTKDGANTGNVAINTLDKPYSLLSSVCLLKTDSDKLLARFLYYYIQSKEGFEQITGQMTGAAIKRIILKTIKSSHIPLPRLPEQQRIVAILDEALKGIATATANTEKNLKNARELFERAMSNTVSDNFKQTGWRKTTVADVALPEKGSMRTGPFGSQLLHSEFVDEGIAVLGIDNAVENQFLWGKKRFITHEKFQELSRYQVKPGDVLITIMGTCGRCAVVPDDIPTSINTKHLCCISLDFSRCLPAFLHAYFLHHPVAQQYLSDRAKGAVMAGLNMGIIKELPLLLPSIPEQKHIVERSKQLSLETQCLAAIYQKKLTALAELKQSLLQKAFSGELTAESASTIKEEALA